MRHLRGNVIVKIDVQQKEKMSFAGDSFLYIPRKFNFNLREDNASYGEIVSSADIKKGSPVLLHHLSVQPSYLIPNDTVLTDEERKEGYQIFNIPEDNVFCYRDNDEEEWKPAANFLITLRVFKPYKGALSGIGNQRVPGVLWVVNGKDLMEGRNEDLSGKCVGVTEWSDYEIIYHTPYHKEGHLIRTRNREIVLVDHGLTEKIKKGELLLGLNEKDCVTLKKLK